MYHIAISPNEGEKSEWVHREVDGGDKRAQQQQRQQILDLYIARV
jgi:hypothetical protein